MVRQVIDSRWKKSIFRTFRLSPALMEMIKVECQRRGTDFSSYMRDAAISAMKYAHRRSRTGAG